MDVEKITPGWLKEKFGWAVSRQDPVHTAQLADGLMGRIHRVECAGHRFVYKTPPKGVSGWQRIFEETGLMNREVQTYNFLHKHHPDIGKTIAPACYWAESGLDGSGALALEDLTESAVQASFANGLTYDQAESAIRSLARLHSISATREGDALKAPYEWVYTAKSGDLMDAIREGVHSIPDLMTTRLPGLLSPAACNHLLKIDIVQTSLNTHGQSSIVSFCHGDSWSNNVLFKKMGNVEERGKAILIDWQFFMWGNPMTDVALLIMSSIDVKKRRPWTEKLLWAYRAELNQHSNIEYSMSDCRDDYRMAQNYAGLVVFSMLETYTNSISPSEYHKLYDRVKDVMEESPALRECLRHNTQAMKHECA
jgi:aminoglycoside phosphotransferase (APT) family kinase protein